MAGMAVRAASAVSALIASAALLHLTDALLQTNPRDSTTQAQVEASCPQHCAPGAVSWDAESPLLPDIAVMDVRKWLAMRPYEFNGFLGWYQAWQYMLAAVMFLVSETSRTVWA